MTTWLAGPASGVELPAVLQMEQRYSIFPLGQVDKGKKPNCIVFERDFALESLGVFFQEKQIFWVRMREDFPKNHGYYEASETRI